MTRFVPAFVLLCTFAALRADNWPEFRGPTQQGHAPGRLPTEWSTTKNVVWKQPIPGAGWSSPIIWENRIFLTTAVPVGDKDDQSLRALCLDVRTGKLIWDREVFRLDGNKAPPIHSKNGHASPTPVTDGRRVYVHFGHQGTAALDFDGKVLWQNRELTFVPHHGCGGSPILAGEALVFNCDGEDKQFIVALNCSTGKVLWQTDRNVDTEAKYSFCTPLLITVNGRQQIVSPAAGAVMAYEPQTGKEIWRVLCPDGYSNVPRPVFGHGLLFLTDSHDNPSLLAVRADGQGDVTRTHVAWRVKKAVPVTPSFLLVGDEVYMISDTGMASCLAARTGKLHWRERLGGNYSASPLAADGKIYFQSEEGVGIVLKAGPKFEVLARNRLEETTMASYAVSAGALLIRTEKHLYRIEHP